MTSHSSHCANNSSNHEQGNHEQGNHEQHNVCPPQHANNPPPQHVNNPPPSPPPDHSPPPNNCTPCGNGGHGSNGGGGAHDAHQAALVSAGLTAAFVTGLGFVGGVLFYGVLVLGSHAVGP